LAQVLERDFSSGSKNNRGFYHNLLRLSYGTTARQVTLFHSQENLHRVKRTVNSRYSGKIHSQSKMKIYNTIKKTAILMQNIKVSSLLLCVFLLLAVSCAGCLTMNMTENIRVSKDAQITATKYSIRIDQSTYNLLKSAAKREGRASVQEMIEANLSKSFGTENAVYNEVWDYDNDKVTITVERNDTYSPKADSRINISKTNNEIVYEDLSFYSDEKPDANLTKSLYFNESQYEQMKDVMLAGISVDYYLEMPGKITDSNAAKVSDNKAEWHLSGSEMTRTKIFAKSEVPLLPWFAPGIAIIVLGLVFVYFGLSRRK
jgi:hypothetical protein